MLLGAFALLGALGCGDGPTGPRFEIVNASLATGIEGEPYAVTLTASGGGRTKTWTVVSGALPPGLTLLANGQLSGTPTTSGRYVFDVRVVSAGKRRTRRFTVDVTARLVAAAGTPPAGIVGTPYRDSLAASGGVGGFAWSLIAGALPGGLTLAPNGVVSGTPTTAQSTTATVRVSSGTQTATRAFDVTIVDVLAITSTGLREAVTGIAYGDTLRATGGLAPFTWSLQGGALPAGVVLFQDGTLGGTPTAAGSGTFTARVVAGTQSATREFTLVAATPLSMTTATLPGGNSGDAYSVPLVAAGGTGTYTWSLPADRLPDGLSLSAAGVLSGTLGAARTDTFTVRVSSGAQAVSREFIVTVAPALAVLTDALRDGIVGAAYSDTLRATGVTTAASWGVLSGALPAGLTLLSSGVLSGTPTTPGTASFTVQVTSGPQTATRALQVLIVPALVLSTTTLPNATVGTAYLQSVTATGGTGSYAWSLVAGTLPAGLVLAPDGTLSGTPTTPSVQVFTLRVVSGVQAAEREFTVQVSPSEPASVEIAPSAGSVELADSTQLAATARDAGGVPLPGRPIAWTTLNAAVATVNGTGLVRGVSLGTVGIVATTAGIGGVPVADTASITVIPVPVDSVEVLPGSASLLLGEVQPMSTVLRDRNGNVLGGRTVTWSSSDGAVAAIDPNTGVVTSGVAGTATVTALSEGVTGTATVLVSRGMILTSVMGGDRHSCGLTEAGLVFCWGRNVEGQLGDSSTIDRLRPVRARGSVTYASVSVGVVGRHSCALTAAGTAYCWGSNSNGRLGTADTVSRVAPTPVAGGLSFASISAGGTHSCGLTFTGTAYCWGTNGVGQLGDNTLFSRNQPTLVQGGLTFASISAGTLHTCGLTAAGAAYCWGSNGFGQTGDANTAPGNRIVPTPVAGGLVFARLKAGGTHTCGITTAGDAYCWGQNGSSGRIGDGSTVTQRSTPTLVSGGVTFAEILPGGVHTCARTAAGALYCWGQNTAGQVGDASTDNRTTPVLVSGGFAWDAFGIGGGHSCAIRDLGRTFCWGQNLEGALGDGTTTPRNVPVPVRP